MIARFGYLLAINWNLGEENTQTVEQQRAMAGYIRSLDPAGHHIVLHANAQDEVYGRLLGEQSPLTGLSLQNSYAAGHERTLRWVNASRKSRQAVGGSRRRAGVVQSRRASRSWLQRFQRQGPAGNAIQTIHDIRKWTLWGNLMAGGAGVEHYFGYQLPENDLVAEDFRIARKVGTTADRWSSFERTKIPFWEMTNANALVGNSNDNSRYCLARGASCTGLSAVWRHRRSRSEPGRRPVPRELVRSTERGKAHARVGAVGCGRCLEIGRSSERP